MTANSNAPKKQIGRPFEKGSVPNPAGRPKGSRNKLGESFIQALYEDFTEHGAGVIARVRDERPQDYLKVTASILPKEFKVETSSVSELSDDELGRLIDLVRATFGASESPGAGADSAQAEQPPRRVPPIH